MIKRWLYIITAVSVSGAACVVIAHTWLGKQTAFPYVDFDSSMKLSAHPEKLTPEWGKPIMDVLRILYERNNAQTITPSSTLRIPKIIHQIWLGSPFPDKYRAWQQSWIHYHPDWEYRLWTDADIEKLHALGDFFVGETYQFYQEAINYGEKSDVLKILLIRYFGGMYVDIDFECLKPCDVFHYCYDMYIGIQPMDVAYVQLGYALFGAAPHNPFIEEVVKTLHTTRHIPEIVAKTGPIMLTRCFVQNALGMRDIIMVALPASYFYPRGYNDPLEPRDWIKSESYAAHHWAGSWLAPEANMVLVK